MSLDRPPWRVCASHRGRRLELRPAAPRDAEALVVAIEASLPELKAFMPWAHRPNTVSQQYERLVTTQADYWGGGDLVFHLWEGEDFLGSFGLHRRTLSPKGIEIGYWVHSAHAGRGLATFATRCLVVLGFEHLGFERIQCGYNSANHGSRRVTEKVGFTPEAQLRHFEAGPSEAQAADGMVTAPTTLLSVLFRDDIARLAWYAPLAAALEVWDWQGRPV